MEWLNYHHLLYFWTVAREGTIAAAGRKLRLAQPTISAQLKRLEEDLGAKLFSRAGRKLELTETGRLVYRYAEEIFTLGRELQDAVQGRPVGSPVRFRVGVTDVVPKLVAYRLLEPAIGLGDGVQIICFEGKSSDLLARLAVHDIDLVLSDAPIAPGVKVQAYNHEIGSCGVTIFGERKQATKFAKKFPRSLDGAPFLLPTTNTALRLAFDGWCDRSGIRPRITGEFEDSALLKVFGQAGVGLFVGPSVIEDEIMRQYRVRVVGRIPEVRERFYAISVERKVKHPAVLELVTTAKNEFFNSPAAG
ncbi:MAG: transcriptional activator NhaR [Gemmatimonadetes bacterium]|nr:transcriptional activator NhaR [Gemmatimonadota bacterium]